LSGRFAETIIHAPPAKPEGRRRNPGKLRVRDFQKSPRESTASIMSFL